jgi:tRNA (uracil-5-)-methyltransferase
VAVTAAALGLAYCRRRQRPPPSSAQSWNNEFVNEDGTYICFDPDGYDALLADKVQAIKRQFAEFLPGGATPGGSPVEVFASPPQNFRMRCRFGVCERGGRVTYVMWNNLKDESKKNYFTQFPLASARINRLMTDILFELNLLPPEHELRAGLRMVHFHDTQAPDGDTLVLLLYDRPLGQPWAAAAAGLRDRLRTGASHSGGGGGAGGAGGDSEAGAHAHRGAQVIGKCKGEGNAHAHWRFWKAVTTPSVNTVLDRDWVVETYSLPGGRRLSYKQVEGSFSNPNARICELTLQWLCSVSKQSLPSRCAGSAARGSGDGPDLLELYCGNGNHTCALAGDGGYRRVLGVDLDKRLVAAANENLRRNGVAPELAVVVASQSASFCRQVLRRRQYRLVAGAAEGGGRGGKKGARRRGGGGKKAGADAGQDEDEDAGADAGEDAGDSAADTARGEAACATADANPAPKLDFDFDFGTVLCDPPRAGLDADTLAAVREYGRVMYISCSPDALLANLIALSETHTLLRFAVFDHFPYTPHLEVGVFLTRR